MMQEKVDLNPLPAEITSDHESLPYPSMPFAYTQPASLSALAWLFGRSSPAADTARVLELGCGGGGNIIPLAHRFPKAQFVGFDLAQRHIEDGQRRIAALGLRNIELVQGDLTNFSSGANSFDYIICHGVFSWVSSPIQDAVFRIVREALAPEGLAVISYNILPGWHLRQIVRDICLRYVPDDGAPHERVTKARYALDRIAKLSSEQTPYGQLLRAEVQRIAQLPAAYVLGEFLATNNSPCHFQDFATRAGHHGLSYLCEGDLGSSIAETLFSKAEMALEGIAGTDRLALEQAKDFVTGRNFRRSVLVRSDAAGHDALRPAVERLRDLHLSADIQRVSDQQQAQKNIYKDRHGRTIRSKDPAVQQALSRLARAYPSTLSFDQLIGPNSHAAAASAATVSNAMLALVAANQINISTIALRVGHAADKKPHGWTVARLEAAARQPWISTQRHEPIAARPTICFLLAYLDGRNDRTELTERLASAFQAGHIKADELKDIDTASPARIREVAAQYVDHTIAYLARHGLLAPPCA